MKVKLCMTRNIKYKVKNICVSLENFSLIKSLKYYIAITCLMFDHEKGFFDILKIKF